MDPMKETKGRKSLHALDITPYSSPIRSLDSSLGSGSLSKLAGSRMSSLGRIQSRLQLHRARSTPKLNTTPVVSSLPASESVAFSLAEQASAADSLSQRNWAHTLHRLPVDVPIINPISTLAFTETFRPPTNTPRNVELTEETNGHAQTQPVPRSHSRVSPIASTFRKFRARRATTADTGIDAKDNKTIVKSRSAFLHPAGRVIMPTLRSTYSDSNLHGLPRRTSQRPSVLRHAIGDVDASPAMPTVPTSCDAGGLGVKGSQYSAMTGKYSFHGPNLNTNVQLVAMEEGAVETRCMGEAENGQEESEEDEGVMIDAGVVIMKAPRKPVPPITNTPTEEAVPQAQTNHHATTKKPRGRPQTLMSCPMVRTSHINGQDQVIHVKKGSSATGAESALSSSSGTEAGSEGQSSVDVGAAGGVGVLCTSPDGVDYADVEGILGVLFPGDRGSEGNPAWNRTSLTIPPIALPEGSSPTLSPSQPRNQVPKAFVDTHSPVAFHPRPSTRRSQSRNESTMDKANGGAKSNLKTASATSLKSPLPLSPNDVLRGYAQLAFLVGRREEE